MDPVEKRAFSRIEKAASWSHRRLSDVFDDWLLILEAALKNAPHLFQSLQNGGTTDPVQAEEAKSAQKALTRYSREPLELLVDSAGDFLADCYNEGLPDYKDRLGVIYMEIGGNERAGQFFTPWDVCRVIAEPHVRHLMELVDRRMVDALNGHLLTQIAGAGAIYERSPDLRPTIVAHSIPFIKVDPVTILDCCIGSGGLLLAVAAELPWWVHQHGLVKFFGQDIDERCCRMARINFMMYGVGQPSHIGPIRAPGSVAAAGVAATETVADFSVERTDGNQPELVRQPSLFDQQENI